MIEKNIRLQPHHSRDLLVGRRSDGQRPKYQPPGYGSSSARDSGSRGGGGPPGGGDRQMTYSAPSPAPDRQDRARQQAAVEQAAAKQRADEQRAEADRQEANRANQLAEARKLMTQPTTVDVPTGKEELIPGTTGSVKIDPYQQSFIEPGSVTTTDFYQEGDYADLVKAPIDVGFQEALRKQQIATDLRQKQQNLNYGQFFKPTPVVEKPQGIMSSLVDKGKGIASNMVRQSILQKLGLGFLNPFIGIASLFGFDPIETLMAKLPRGTGTKTAWTKPREGEGKEQYKKEFITTEPKDVITESIKKFKPTDQQTAQINEIMRKKMILQGYADKGTLNEKGMNVLAQMNQLINQYQVNPESIWT